MALAHCVHWEFGLVSIGTAGGELVDRLAFFPASHVISPLCEFLVRNHYPWDVSTGEVLFQCQGVSQPAAAILLPAMLQAFGQGLLYCRECMYY